jgi:hypothetical protein
MFFPVAIGKKRKHAMQKVEIETQTYKFYIKATVLSLQLPCQSLVPCCLLCAGENNKD